MHITISASGTPAQVNAAIATQLKAEASRNPGAWPTLVSARDYIAQHVGNAGESDSVTVSATIALEIGITPASPVAAVAPVAASEPEPKPDAKPEAKK